MSRAEDEVQQRLSRLEELKAKGIEPYPNNLHPSHLAADLQARYQGTDGESLEKLDEKFSQAEILAALPAGGVSISR